MNQQEFNEIFDMKSENKPQKSFNKSTKRMLTYAVCAIIGIAVAALGILVYNLVADNSGADTPEEAVAGCQKADLLYDVDGMVRFSSEYNRIAKGGKGMSEAELIAHMNKLYSNTESSYSEENISFQLEYIREYPRNEGKYNLIMDKYCQMVPDGREKIDKVAIVHMTVFNGVTKNPKAKDYVAVHQDGKWYYAFGYVE